jgi:acetyl-CoA carboxylase biotin carboxyl carrier protein
MMVANELMEISIRDGDTEVTLRRPHANSPPVVTIAPPAGPLNGNPGALSSSSVPTTPLVEEEPRVETIDIKSPMVGTFYAASDPNSAAYVQVGTRVQPATVVCIIEAMKVFNEIKAEVAGVIERILAKNGQPVEFGQPLFRVRPE